MWVCVSIYVYVLFVLNNNWLALCFSFFRMHCGNKDSCEKSQFSTTSAMNLGMHIIFFFIISSMHLRTYISLLLENLFEVYVHRELGLCDLAFLIITVRNN